jgi:hypothetical protein
MTDFSGHLQIADADLDELLSALRRHDRADAERLLERWATSERNVNDDAEIPDDELWDDDMLQLLHLDHDLSAWVHREASHHVAGGRFEHALCLVEAYRRPFKAADMAARLTLSSGADR